MQVLIVENAEPTARHDRSQPGFHHEDHEEYEEMKNKKLAW
jgi:hypothetical protein